MKFTLNLPDYLEQYVTNSKKDEPYCPICYERCMTFEHKEDIEHIIDCYKEQIVLEKLSKIIEETGEVPALDAEFLQSINLEIEQEMVRYYSKI